MRATGIHAAKVKGESIDRELGLGRPLASSSWHMRAETTEIGVLGLAGGGPEDTMGLRRELEADVSSYNFRFS